VSGIIPPSILIHFFSLVQSDLICCNSEFTVEVSEWNRTTKHTNSIFSWVQFDLICCNSEFTQFQVITEKITGGSLRPKPKNEKLTSFSLTCILHFR
jgi:hypothetical protein